MKMHRVMGAALVGGTLLLAAPALAATVKVMVNGTPITDVQGAQRLALMRLEHRDGAKAATEEWINEALASMPDKVQAYQKGKKGLIGLFVGDVKKRSGGKADPQRVLDMIKEKLG